ncbi:MAG: stage II sporulation protein M [Halobellus sp.]|uniref:stage II sporulation protein M n=1 Tax=Halobellus sp. TaxID=1979212 RepID=UPI0035D466A7
MKPSSALRTSWRLLSERSASVLPVYLLVSGLYGVARVPVLLAGLFAVWLAAASGRLDPFIDQLRQLQSAPSGGSGGSGIGDPSTFDPQMIGAGLGEAVAGLLTPEIVALVAVGALTAIALALLASALGSAAAIGGIFGLLRGRDGVRAAVEGARTHWRSVLGVRVLFLLALAAVVVPVGGVVAGVAGAVFSASASAGGSAAGAPSVGGSLLGVGVALLGTLLGALLVLAVVLLFAFAEQAVVVDDAGAFAAVRKSAGFPIDRPVAFLGYVAVAAGAVVLIGTATAIGSVVGANRVTGLLGVIIIPPILDGVKTSLYAETTLPADPDPTPLDARARAAFSGGLRAVGEFVRDRPGANFVSLGCVAAGGVIGWLATSSVGVTLPVSGDVGTIFGGGAFGPLGTAANLAVNNWLVAVGLAYSGLAAGIPAVVNLGFNGLIVGAVGGVFEPVAFLALVAPHGVIEIPSIVVGGALGLRLGLVGVGALRGRRTDDEIARAIRHAYRVLLGLVPLFVVAALVEAFLTPAIASLVLGG